MQNTHSLTNDTTSFTTSFTTNLITKICALFGHDDSLHAALATSCANEIRSVQSLAVWVQSLDSLSQRERTACLLKAAATFRGDWATYGLADSLCRMADRPALFRAVVGDLAAHAPFQFAHAA